MSVILFSLLLAAASGETGATPAKVDPLDTVKCVREDVIGSIAQKRKVCHTLREWEAIRRNAQDESRRIIQPGQPTQSN
jgi:hypothetical protein